MDKINQSSNEREKQVAAVADNERMSVDLIRVTEERARLEPDLEASKKSEAELQTFMDQKIRATKAESVREFQASDICKKDIVALNNLIYVGAYKDAVDILIGKFLELNLTREDLDFDANAKGFDEYLAKYQETDQISELWLEEDGEETNVVSTQQVSA